MLGKVLPTLVELPSGNLWAAQRLMRKGWVKLFTDGWVSENHTWELSELLLEWGSPPISRAP